MRRLAGRVAGWLWGVIGGVVVLIAVGAFLAWGPVGLGAGPLSVAFVASSGTVPQTRPTMVLIPIEARLSASVVIDRVGITGGGGYPPPLLLSVVGDQDQNCSGIWWPLAGHNGFLRRCAHSGTVPVLGHLVPIHPATLVSTAGTRGAGSARRTIELAIKVGAPGSQGCWGIGNVAVHYHVGHRHYTVVASESISGCTANASQLDPGGQTGPVPPTAGVPTTGLPTTGPPTAQPSTDQPTASPAVTSP